MDEPDVNDLTSVLQDAGFDLQRAHAVSSTTRLTAAERTYDRAGWMVEVSGKGSHKEKRKENKSRKGLPATATRSKTSGIKRPQDLPATLFQRI